MQDVSDLTDQVREIMATTFGVDESELPEDVHQGNFTKWDSLHHMTLLLALEEHFDTTFSTEEMPEMTSIGKIIDVLQEHNAA